MLWQSLLKRLWIVNIRNVEHPFYLIMLKRIQLTENVCLKWNVYFILYNFHSKPFFPLTSILWVILQELAKRHLCIHVKLLFQLSATNKYWNGSRSVHKILQNHISWKSVQWVLKYFMHMDETLIKSTNNTAHYNGAALWLSSHNIDQNPQNP